MLVHVGNGKGGAVRQGQGAAVGGLAAAFGIKHRAVQRNAPAAGLFVRFGGKDAAFAFGAEGVLFKIFFCALHGAGTSCDVMKNSFRHRCAMPPPSKREAKRLPLRGSCRRQATEGVSL